MTTLKFGVVVLFYKYLEYPLTFFLGGTAYMLIEILWRGYTHWTMGICAGICFVGIYWFEQKHPQANLFLKCLFGVFFIAANEFVAGCIVNIILGWHVWDYSNMPLNLLGQVCLPFLFLWFLLCFPAFLAARGIKYLFNEKTVEIDRA